MPNEMTELSAQHRQEIAAQLYEALGSPCGIEVRTSDAARYMNMVYRVRKMQGDPALDGLALKRCPTQPDRVWIIKQQDRTQAQTGAK